MSYKLMHWLLLSLGVIRHGKMSVSAPLHVGIMLNIGKCEFYIIKSISYTDIGECLHLEVRLPIKTDVLKSCLYLCVFHLSAFVGTLITRASSTVLFPR